MTGRSSVSQRDKIIGKDSQSKEYQSIYQQLKAEGPEVTEKRETHFANSNRFNSIIGLVIVANAITIGVEVDNGRGFKLEDRFGFFLIEVLFICIFFGEMVMRQNLLGWNYFLDAWNVMDYFLVVIGFVDICVSVIYTQEADMKVLTAFRIIRMLRIVRNVRLLRMFRELWMIVRGFFDSLSTLGWVSLLLTLAVYICAIYLVMVVGHSPDSTEYWRYTDIYIGTVPRAMWTLFQVITFDAWTTDIARPIISLNSFSLVVFLLLIVSCTLGALNVIVGVIVERTLTVAMENEQEVQKVIEECEKQVMESMGAEFVNADKDGSEELDYEEFRQAIRTGSFPEKLRLIEVPIDEAEELFFLMDVDKSGTVSAEEFVSGIQRLKGGAKGKDMVQLISSTQRHLRRATKITERIERLNQKADKVLLRLDTMWAATDQELKERSFALKRQKELEESCRTKHQILKHIDNHTTMTFPKLGGEV